nr:ankyrin repeat domain-containing protein [Alphaproteobacteria bacterium]
NEGITPLDFARNQNNPNIVKYLIEHGAKFDTADMLIWAAQEGHLDVVKYLVEHDADVNIADKDGCTAAIVAMKNSHFGIVRYLIDKNIDVNKTDKSGNDLLFYAREKGISDIIEHLEIIAAQRQSKIDQQREEKRLQDESIETFYRERFDQLDKSLLDKSLSASENVTTEKKIKHSDNSESKVDEPESDVASNITEEEKNIKHSDNSESKVGEPKSNDNEWDVSSNISESSGDEWDVESNITEDWPFDAFTND